MAEELRVLGFSSVEIHASWGTVSAQKPLRGEIQAAIDWGTARFARYRDVGVAWYGAQTVFPR
jgi:hypothetical protein